MWLKLFQSAFKKSMIHQHNIEIILIKAIQWLLESKVGGNGQLENQGKKLVIKPVMGLDWGMTTSTPFSNPTSVLSSTKCPRLCHFMSIDPLTLIYSAA